jgi:16S rRNA (guanine966-N2)-methyltransferase
MRVVAGSHRGRTLQAPPGLSVRPTSERTREAVFNILAHARWSPDDRSPLLEARVLDAFCGSGALGFEALSRGAASCLFLDRNQAALDCVRQNAAALDEDSRVTILRADATKPPPGRVPFTLAFLDPPYGETLLEPALTALAAHHWFAPGAIVVVEAENRDPFTRPNLFEPLDERRYRYTTVRFLRFGRETPYTIEP